MSRALIVGAIAVASLMVGWSGLRIDPDACQLITLADASALIGPAPLTHSESSATFSTCVYSRPNQNPLATRDHVEIHYYLLADVPSAQAKFQKVVHPGPMMGTTVTAVSNLGDEADIKRTPAYMVNSVEFRRGVAIVTIGVSPLVADSSLMTAGKTALGRL